MHPLKLACPPLKFKSGYVPEFATDTTIQFVSRSIFSRLQRNITTKNRTQVVDVDCHSMNKGTGYLSVN